MLERFLDYWWPISETVYDLLRSIKLEPDLWSYQDVWAGVWTFRKRLFTGPANMTIDGHELRLNGRRFQKLSRRECKLLGVALAQAEISAIEAAIKQDMLASARGELPLREVETPLAEEEHDTVAPVPGCTITFPADLPTEGLLIAEPVEVLNEATEDLGCAGVGTGRPDAGDLKHILESVASCHDMSEPLLAGDIPPGGPLSECLTELGRLGLIGKITRGDEPTFFIPSHKGRRALAGETGAPSLKDIAETMAREAYSRGAADRFLISEVLNGDPNQRQHLLAHAWRSQDATARLLMHCFLTAKPLTDQDIRLWATQFQDVLMYLNQLAQLGKAYHDMERRIWALVPQPQVETRDIRSEETGGRMVGRLVNRVMHGERMPGLDITRQLKQWDIRLEK